MSVAIFGGLCGDELLPLYIVNQKFNAEQYTDVLEQLYWPVLQEKFDGADFVYQQDNSPVHRGRVVREWLESVPEFEGKILFQPPYSPDLNPIEHVWARLKSKLSGRIFWRTDTLISAITEAYDDINVNEKAFLKTLTNSMGERLEAIIDALGGPTKY